MESAHCSAGHISHCNQAIVCDKHYASMLPEPLAWAKTRVTFSISQVFVGHPGKLSFRGSSEKATAVHFRAADVPEASLQWKSLTYTHNTKRGLVLKSYQ